MGDSDAAKPDLGAPASYLVLEEGEPVYSRDGELVGKVERVLADEEIDIFDGLVLDDSELGERSRFVAGEQVEEVFERGVLLKLDRAAAEGLAEPREDRAG